MAYDRTGPWYSRGARRLNLNEEHIEERKRGRNDEYRGPERSADKDDERYLQVGRSGANLSPRVVRGPTEAEPPAQDGRPERGRPGTDDRRTKGVDSLGPAETSI